MRYERVLAFFGFAVIAALIAGLIVVEVHERSGARGGPLGTLAPGGGVGASGRPPGRPVTFGLSIENPSGQSFVLDRVTPVDVSGPIALVGMGVGRSGIGSEDGYPPTDVHLVPVPGARIPPHSYLEVDVGVKETASGVGRIGGFRVAYHSLRGGTYRYAMRYFVQLAS